MSHMASAKHNSTVRQGPKDLNGLKSMLPAILDIWEASSKGDTRRYTSKWVSPDWPEILNEMWKIEQEFMDNMANRVTYSEAEVREQCNMVME